jgi:hypothetical protein
VRPARLGRHPKDTQRPVLVWVLRVGALCDLGFKPSVLLLEGIGDVLEEMAPRFVAPYRKGGKNDGNDAEAMCEAIARPGMRFVLVKSAEQQAVLCLHRIRQGLIKDGTAAIHQLRGLVMSQGRYPAQHSIPRILEDGENGLPLRARRLPPMHRARLLKRVFDIDIDKPGTQTYRGKLLRTQQCPRVAAAP